MTTQALSAKATVTQTGRVAGRHAPHSNGRCFTLEDTVEYFNLVEQFHLTAPEEQELVAVLRARNGRTHPMSTPKSFTLEQAEAIGEQLGIRWETFDLEQFRAGLGVELEHGTANPTANITNDDPLMTGKIALAHLAEFPDYYTRLSQMEAEAKRYWSQAR